MLPNKKRKLLKRIEYGEKKRDNESENLRRKRARLEKAKLAAQALVIIVVAAERHKCEF